MLFAQAMIPEPSLLVLDEPTDRPGPGRQGHPRDAPSATSPRRGGTVVWINHDIVQVNEIADAHHLHQPHACCWMARRARCWPRGAAAQLFPTLALPAREAAHA